MTLDDGDGLGSVLHEERPVIRPAVRGDLARHLIREGAEPARPPQLWAVIALAGVLGASLLIIAALAIPG
jgi:hypothetical protein